MLRILCRLARPAGESRARQLSLGQSQQKAAAKEDYGLAARALIPTSSSVILSPKPYTLHPKLRTLEP
jgi:hypothetical protein